jgi:hypothetical protein
MPTTSCAVVGCKHNKAQLRKYEKEMRPAHYDLVTFPLDDEGRKRWEKLVNRKEKKDGKEVPWTRKAYSRICSKHFIDGIPTAQHPDPVLHMGYTISHNKSPRAPPKPRSEREPPTKRARKSAKLDPPQPSPTACPKVSTTPKPPKKIICVSVPTPTCSSGQKTQEPPTPKFKSLYYLSKPCENPSATLSKPSQRDYTAEILELKRKLAIAQAKVDALTHAKSKPLATKLLTSDQKVSFYTGIPNLKTFHLLLEYMEPKAERMTYWRGDRKLITSKARYFHRSPKKFGPRRKLQIIDELFLKY